MALTNVLLCQKSLGCVKRCFGVVPNAEIGLKAAGVTESPQFPEVKTLEKEGTQHAHKKKANGW